MANPEESSPLLPKHEEVVGREDAPKQEGETTATKVVPATLPSESTKGFTTLPSETTKGFTTLPSEPMKGCNEWTVDGLPLGHGSVVGEPVARARWDSSLFACLGRNDEFCSSDLEVCLLGSFAPCVLYGSNAERIGSGSGTFANHCLPYTGLYMLGHSLFGWNCLAPFVSHASRTALRRKFNIEGSCEAFSRSCGCCGGVLKDELQREVCESMCDLAAHIFCHACSLCQEGRELRRRLPHPGFNGRSSVLVMIPPMEQTMGRGA